MTDLQKAAIKSRLANLDPIMDEEQVEEGDDNNLASSPSSADTVIPSPTRQLFARPSRGYV